MTPKNKKPGAIKRPGKEILRWDHSPRLRALHHEIEQQAAECIAARRHWHPSDYPALWSLLESAKAEARRRDRLRGRIVFRHQSKTYAARFTNLDRIIVEDRKSGRFIASSGFFAL